MRRAPGCKLPSNQNSSTQTNGSGVSENVSRWSPGGAGSAPSSWKWRDTVSEESPLSVSAGYCSPAISLLSMYPTTCTHVLSKITSIGVHGTTVCSAIDWSSQDVHL